MVQAPGPCPRCGSENLEKCHKPNGGPAWFCIDCTWIGDAQSIAEGCPGLASMPMSKPPVEDVQAMTAEPNKENKKSRGGKGGKGQA